MVFVFNHGPLRLHCTRYRAHSPKPYNRRGLMSISAVNTLILGMIVWILDMRSKTKIWKGLLPDADPNPDSFYFALMRVAVAQICKQIGFKSTTESSLLVLTRITTLHLQTLATEAASYSNLSGRSDSNLFDLQNAIYDVSLSNSADCLTGIACSSPFGSNTEACIHGLIRFVESSLELPFAKPIPNRLQPFDASPRGSIKSWPRHVPGWLPAFPDTAANPDVSAANNSALITKPSRNLWGEKMNRHAAVEEEADEKFDQLKRVDQSANGRDGGELAADKKKFEFKFSFRARK